MTIIHALNATLLATMHEKGEEPRKEPAMHNPLPVSGYKPQPEQNVRLVNANKDAEERILRSLDGLKDLPGVDQRWLAIGRTHIEQGFMAVNRAIFQPARAQLPEEMS